MEGEEYNQTVYQNIHCDNLDLSYDVVKKTFVMVSCYPERSLRGSAWKLNC